MITKTWKNNMTTTRVNSFSNNSPQWVHDFEMELLENNREIFLRVYNTDVEDFWLETAND